MSPTLEIEKGEMPIVWKEEEALCFKCKKIITAGSQIEFERFTGKRWHLACSETAEPTVETTGDAKGDDLPTEIGVGQAGSGEDLLAKALKDNVPLIADPKVFPMPIPPEGLLADAIRKTVQSAVQQKVDEALPEIQSPESLPLLTGSVERKRIKGMFHKNLPMLLKLVGIRNANGQRLNVYMHGPAGGGKSTAAKQASDMNKLEWGYTSLNPQTPDSRILGYMHAGGEYVESEFFRRYTKGGVFCFDEIDNASASLVTTLNSMLENGSGAFPHGVFDRHPDFVCVCTANTIGRGGDVHYPERRPLDGAFLERFVFLEWAHDTKLTQMIVERTFNQNKKLASDFMAWVAGEGQKLTTRFPQALVTPRAFIQGALLETRGVARTDIYHMVIGRGVKLPNDKNGKK